ncbi:MAG: DEAD/DEAH box helicase family protein, partial [Deltaproteobacteria bacterium]|nr:DEAD/DEAH box helicase family protein [Deltaproteobacteria bacterium]
MDVQVGFIGVRQKLLIFQSVQKCLAQELYPILGCGGPFPFSLNDLQEAAVRKIAPGLGGGFSRWLLHGVTGSGKTAVYLDLINKTIQQGKSVLFLLPEINLTPQFLKTFQQYT